MVNINKMALLALFLGPLAAPSSLFASDWLTSCPQGQDLAAWCQKNLENEERELQTELFTLVNIDGQEEWNQTKQELAYEYETTCTTSRAEEFANKPLPKKLMAHVKHVLNNKKIRALLQITSLEQAPDNMFIKAHRANGKTITIARGNHKVESPAATDQYTTLLYPEELLKAPTTWTEIEVTLAHELMHIANEDSFNMYCLNQFYETKKQTHSIPTKKFNTMKGKWERLQEKRADLLAGLIDVQYAQAFAQEFKRDISPNEKLKPTSTHPTAQDRYEYLTTLTTVMQSNQPLEASASSQSSPSIWILLLSLMALAAGAMMIQKHKNMA